ncbi:MAG: hypothetical protein QNJ65_22000 [Xenococcaceae cyanobacterium MO_234.B1]|nr:hypothetical protein [Xenococcaceae cyanobacterium MO_234.B1]
MANIPDLKDIQKYGAISSSLAERETIEIICQTQEDFDKAIDNVSYIANNSLSKKIVFVFGDRKVTVSSCEFR